jgi:hypothetical protein
MRLRIEVSPCTYHGNLVGDIRKWTREFGYEFLLKRSHKAMSTPRPNGFVLPDGREIQIRNVLTRANNLTHWGEQSGKSCLMVTGGFRLHVIRRAAIKPSGYIVRLQESW